MAKFHPVIHDDGILVGLGNRNMNKQGKTPCPKSRMPSHKELLPELSLALQKAGDLVLTYVLR